MPGARPVPGNGHKSGRAYAGLRSLPIGNYVVFYLPIENGIEIVRVLPGMRDIDAFF